MDNRNDNMSTDAVRADNLQQKATTAQNQYTRIDTPKEVQDAFQNWFTYTGLYQKKKPMTIAYMQTLVRNAMENLGYK